MTVGWRPILEGGAGEAALATALEIAEALRAPPPQLRGWLDAELALLFMYAAQAWANRGFDDAAFEFLERAGEAVAKLPMPDALHGGFVGVAWVTQHLHQGLLDPEDEDPNHDIDEALLARVGQTPWLGNYDLVSGLAGIGVYALARLPRRSGAGCMERILDRFAETAERRPGGGITWRTAPELMDVETRAAHPDGYYNLGLAHGVPAVIQLLGQACAAGIHVAKARPLLDGAVAWLLESQIADDPRGRFPWVEGVPDATRCAWCYGDPGVAVALLSAARAVREPRWEEQALVWARASARLPPDQSGVVDAGVCHGAAGLAHLFNRFHQATGEAVFLDSARYWLDRTLSMRRASGDGTAGYLFWGLKAGGAELGWIEDHSILSGAAGVALTLLGASTAIEPAWDAILMSALAPTAG